MAILEAGRQALRRALVHLPLRGAHGRVAHDRAGPRIAVIGNCQARGLARSLEVVLPEARITLLAGSRIGRGQRDPAAFARSLKTYDHVFFQPLSFASEAEAGQDAFTQLLPQARLFPAIVFAAYHPDMIYVGSVASGAEAGLVPSPLQTYHSAITLFGFLRGLSAPRIASLFREDVFERLGYLDGWTFAADDLTQSSAAIGLNLGPELLRWSRRGAFMHGINHPKLFVMADIARRLAEEAGLSPAAVDVETCRVDELLDDVVWPIYPPVAAVYGLEGSYAFKGRSAPKAAPAILDLDRFIGESLAIYGQVPRERMTSHRIDHWSRLPEICALFDGA